MTTRLPTLLRSAAALIAVSVLGLGVAWLRGGDAAGERSSAASPAERLGRREGPLVSRGAALPAPGRPVERPARFDAFPGDLFRYRLNARWTARIDTSDAPSGPDRSFSEAFPSRVATRLDGTLEVVVVSRDEHEYLLRFAVRDPVATVDVGTAVRPFEPGALEQPVFVRFANDGRVLGYAFEPDVPEHTQSLLVGAFALSHQFVIRDQSSAWTVSDLRDDVGSFSARFRWADTGRLGAGTVRRSVLSYGAPGQRVGRSASHARIADGWIASAEAREERVARLEGVLAATVSVRVAIELAERSAMVVEGLAPADGRPWQSGPVETAVAETTAPDGATERMAAIDDPEDALEGTLAALAALAGTDDLYGPPGFEAWRRLAELARHFPEQVLPPMLDHLTSGELGTASQNWLLSALGKAGGAGSEAATAVLAAVIGAAGLPNDVRESALIAAFQLGSKVTPEIIEIATGILLADASVDGTLPGTAALLLGNFAGQPGLPADSRALLDAGLDLARETAFARDQPDVFFHALRNSRRPDLLALSFAYLDHTDVAVRRGAVETLGALAENPRTRDALAHAARRDESPLVRGAALASLADLPPTRQTTTLLRRVAGRDAEPTVRIGAVDALALQAERGSSEAYEALVDLARSAGEAGDRARSTLADLEESKA